MGAASYIRKESMHRRVKIKGAREANLIIKEAESLIRKGRKLTDGEEADYHFARMFLNDLGKRKKKKGGEPGATQPVPDDG